MTPETDVRKDVAAGEFVNPVKADPEPVGHILGRHHRRSVGRRGGHGVPPVA